MSNDAVISRVEGVSIRRQKRWVSKKRKVEAFLNLIAAEEEQEREMKKCKSSPSNKPRSIEEDFKALLSHDSLLKKKQLEGEPNFFLTEHGLKAQINFQFYNREKPLGETLAPLFVEDIQHLLLRAIIGGSSAVKTRWCNIVRDRKLSHIVLFVIDGVSKNTVVNSVSMFSKTIDIFNNIVDIVSPDVYSLNFGTELCGVHLNYSGKDGSDKDDGSNLGICTAFKPLSSMFPTEDPKPLCADTNYSKLHLLLSPIQLVMEAFPLPLSVFPNSNSDGYIFTKDKYAHVTAQSPLYALDCEMCRMVNGRMEVTWIAIIDEEFNTVYKTLVKPKGHVADYLTKYSGVTKDMLSSVKVTLDDVQKEIQSLLPADAILCGQSLNFDLHALRMIHPYVIDTSVIYNKSGCRTKKVALKVLSDTYLNEEIQASENGHNPVEDCIATLKLVQLKLKNGPEFGDAILSAKNVFAKKPPAEEKSTEKTAKGSLSTSFFSKVLNQRKTICIIGNEKTQAHYLEEMVPNTVKRIIKPNPKKIVKHAINTVSSYDFSICHIDVSSCTDNSELCSTLDSNICKLYSACQLKSLFVVVAAGLNRKNAEETYENALCMVTIKNET